MIQWTEADSDFDEEGNEISVTITTYDENGGEISSETIIPGTEEA
jgi:hypothetical protein